MSEQRCHELMAIDFTKMHGLGNDFIVVDNRDGLMHFDAQAIQALADRHTGIGFDQLLVVQSPSVAEAEFDYRIFNADGGEVEHCGNGARCFARYVTDRGFTQSRRIPVKTSMGLLQLELRAEGDVMVEMGVPDFTPAHIPFTAESKAVSYSLDVAGSVHEVGAVAIGNPHVVLEVDSVDSCPLETLGPLMERHERFPARVNVGFLEIVDRQSARLRVYERGVGETRACGSGACAALAVAVRQGKLDRTATMSLSGGDLYIHWPEDHKPIEMTGPCSTVFEGTTRLPACKPTKPNRPDA